MYGPTDKLPIVKSPITYGPDGKTRLSWETDVGSGIQPGMPQIPKIRVELVTSEDKSLIATFPNGKSRRLLSNVDELVMEHWGRLEHEGLPASLDVTLVTEQRRDGLLVFEVIVSNGSCVGQPQFSGCIRFRSIGIKILETGWYKTGTYLGGIGDWYWGIRTATSARYVACQSRALVPAASALLQQAGLEIPSPLQFMGAGGHTMSKLMDHRADPLWSNPVRQGPFWYDTITQVGYDTGDKGIDPIGGWEMSPAAARSIAEDLPRIMARHGCALTDSDTGEPFWPERWTAASNYALYDNRYSVDPWNWQKVQGSIVGYFGWDRGNNPQGWQLPREWNPGPSQLRNFVLTYQAHDVAHLARVTSRALAAWQLTRSWAARWLLRMNACDVMTSYSIQPGGRLLVALAQARLKPGQGWEYLRAQGHAMEAVAAALAITPPGPERDRYLLWRTYMLELQSLIIPSNGVSSFGAASQSYANGVPWIEGLPADYSAGVTFQLAIWANGLYDLDANGPEHDPMTKDRISWMLTRYLKQLAGVLVLDNKGQMTPPSWLGVAKGNPPVIEDPIRVGSTSLSYTGHSNHELHGCMLAAAVTGEQRWRKFCAKFGTLYPSPDAQLAAWKALPSAWTALPIAMGGAT